MAAGEATGPAILSAGFRPFFLLGGLWAALAMALWLATLTGRAALPAAFGPLDWHVHELVFGYGAAVVCGFLLTAIPNWTGRLPLRGAPLAGLAALWLAGRAAVTLGGALPAGWVAAFDLGFLATLSAVIAREIVAGRNTRNLPVLGLCLAFLAGNAGFHWQAAHGAAGASGGAGARAGIAVLILLISLIGGRIVPSFTRNWLAQRGPGRLPVPFGGFDTAVLGISAAALAMWIAAPQAAAAGWALAAAGVMQGWRLARWAGWRTLSEPLVWVLHLGYGFVPLGFVLLGAAALAPDRLAPLAGLHAWLAGGVGLMTLAVMTRASLGHTGRALVAGGAETAIYGMILTAAAARIGAGLGGPHWLLHTSAGAWIGGFALFSATYWPVLTRPRLARKRPSRVPSA